MARQELARLLPRLALVELICGAFVAAMAWDRAAIDRSYATIATILTAAYFITRALDHLISGWEDYFQRFQDITDLSWWDIKDDFPDSKE